MSHSMKFSQSVGIEPFVSKDAHHNVTYGAATTVPANVDYITKKITDQNGKEIVSTAWVALPPGTVLTGKERVTLPNGSKQFIGSFGPATNFRTGETHYIEVYVSKVKPGETN